MYINIIHNIMFVGPPPWNWEKIQFKFEILRHSKGHIFWRITKKQQLNMLHLHYVKESGKTSQRPKRRVTSFADGIWNLDACLKTLHWWAVWYAKILKNINKDLCRQAGWETMVFKCCLKATIGWRKLTNDMIEYCKYHSTLMSKCEKTILMGPAMVSSSLW